LAPFVRWYRRSIWPYPPDGIDRGAGRVEAVGHVEGVLFPFLTATKNTLSEIFPGLLLDRNRQA